MNRGRLKKPIRCRMGFDLIISTLADSIYVKNKAHCILD